MNKSDLTKIKKLVQGSASADLSDPDVGQTYAEVASTYLKANNRLLRNYNTFLRGVVAGLKELREKEKSFSLPK